MEKKKEVVTEVTEPVGEIIDELGSEVVGKVENVEVTLNLGPAEFVGQHTIFIGGKSIIFLDGAANVSPDQVEVLKKHGYIK